MRIDLKDRTYWLNILVTSSCNLVAITKKNPTRFMFDFNFVINFNFII